MGIKSIIINDHQADKVVTQSEGHFSDIKDIRITPAKLTKTISALANTDGGELYIGIEDSPRKWNGFIREEDANGHIQAFEALFPLGRDFSYSFLVSQGRQGLVLKIEIQKTPDIKYASDQKAYIRRGAQNLPVVTNENLERLKFNKGISSFEDQVITAEPQVITNSEPMLAFMIEIVPDAEPEPWLRKNRLLSDQGPTVAGAILFAEEPQALVPKRTGLKVYRYKTSAKEGSRDTLAFDPITVEGHAYNQISNAVAEITRIIGNVEILGPDGMDKAKYPAEALHEIITNAVLHRDYSLADDIHVRIFDNRIEVESPGRLPAHITPKNILDERFARNASIVRLVNKFPNPPNKDVGEGLNTAFAAMRKMQLKEPEIVEKDNSVLVLIRHEPLASPESIVMAFLNKNPEIGNTKAREIAYIGSESVVRKMFSRMIASGIIEPVPGKRGRASSYRKKL